MSSWPEWWDWELEFSPHLLKRMMDRGFTEIEVRLMMDNATALREAEVPLRWIAETAHDSCPWSIIVEPDMADRLLIVITAYPLAP